MPTLHVHIDDAPAGEPYPLRLLLDDGRPGWDDAALALGSIPHDLAIPNPPPHPDGTGEILTVESGVEWFLSLTDPPPNGAEVVGTMLFQLLDQPGVSAPWRTVRDEAWAKRLTGEPLRTVLHIHAPALRALPWELVHHKHRFFHTEALGPWYRAAPASVPAGAPIGRPLRILVIVGCKEDDHRVRWREEVQAICDVTCLRRTLFDVELLERPSTQQLAQLLTDFAPHVVHFVGHGTAEMGSEKAALEMWDEAAKAGWGWTSTEIFQRLQAAPPRLAFINACRSADFAGEVGSWRIADSLVEAGVAAVIGMQGDIGGEAASFFAARIYSQLADGVAIDRAVATARMDTSQAAFVKGGRDWVLPTLTLAGPPDEVLAMEPAPPEPLARLAEASGSLQRLGKFVGRRRERRQVRDAAASRGNLLVLAGGEAVGKSDFIKTCLEFFALRGARVVYVDLATGQRHDAIKLLRAIRGLKSSTTRDLLRPELYPHFAGFNEELNALLAGKPAPTQLQGTPESATDADAPYFPDRAHPETHTRAFESFNRALVRSAGDEPLIVVVDHLGGPNGGMTPDEFTRYVRPLFVDAVLRGELPGVHLVLTLRDEHVKEFGLGDLLAGQCGHTLKPFPGREWRWLASEYLLARKIDRTRAEQPMAMLEAEFADDGFTPEDLEALADFVARFKGRGP